MGDFHIEGALRGKSGKRRFHDTYRGWGRKRLHSLDIAKSLSEGRKNILG